MGFEIHDDASAGNAPEATTYAVIADPQEHEIRVDEEYDAIICTGDMLYLAPPPGADSLNESLIAEYSENAEELYAAEDVPGILEEVSRLSEDSDVKSAAEKRYRKFFSGIEKPFYYVTGNQDIPDAIDAVAEEYEHIHHVNELDEFVGIDGIVPAFAGVPAGHFPSEIEKDKFYAEVKAADEPVLVAHSIGDEDATSLGVEAVLSSKNDREQRRVESDTARLASHTTEDYLLLFAV